MTVSGLKHLEHKIFSLIYLDNASCIDIVVKFPFKIYPSLVILPPVLKYFFKRANISSGSLSAILSKLKLLSINI